MSRIPVLLLLTAVAVLAQTTGTAALVGTVSDPTGAAVPGAKVTVRDMNTSFVYEGVTCAAGDYYVPNLSSGSHQLTIEASGFKSYVRSDIVLPQPAPTRLLSWD